MSHISIEPAKYVESCVDESRARRYFVRASASSWKPPSTIRLDGLLLGHAVAVDPGVDDRVRSTSADRTSSG
jgi:hypothetical protein